MTMTAFSGTRQDQRLCISQLGKQVAFALAMYLDGVAVDDPDFAITALTIVELVRGKLGYSGPNV